MESNLKVVKIGGHIIDEEESLVDFLRDFAAMQGPKILVHGGGKLATRMSRQMGIKVEMVNGRRITTDENLEVVTMVYAGLVNKKICAQLQHLGCNAIGLSGADANLIKADKRPALPVDYGWVGDVRSVNVHAIQQFLSAGLTPICCAITHDGRGQLLNTNADTVAAELAIAGSKLYDSELIYCFEKMGVLSDAQNEASVIEMIDRTYYAQLKDRGVIQGGMLPKIDNCFHALQGGVRRVRIGNAGAIKTASKTGTEVYLNSYDQ